MTTRSYVSSMDGAFDFYLAPGKPAYCEGEVFDAMSVLARIQEEGGVAVLAHPWCCKGNVEPMVADMAQHGLWGMEVFK